LDISWKAFSVESATMIARWTVLPPLEALEVELASGAATAAARAAACRQRQHEENGGDGGPNPLHRVDGRT
jgi:hypothetical protein